MSTFKESVHSPRNVALRNFWIEQRLRLGMSQRALAEKLNVTHSLIGKVETGDRRLDILEVIQYSHALELDPRCVIDLLDSTRDE